MSTTTTLQQVLDAKVKLTPMMEQYSSIKENYSDHLLLFRMGDFYEVFFEDAVRASKLLNITLTHRGKIGDFPIPMAGIPHHAAAVYIDRLSNMGLKVAICEQIQDPKDAKGIVKRAVTQVVSPGMPFDLDKTDSGEQRFMASSLKTVINGEEKYLLVVLDFTTGEFDGLILDDLEALINKLRLYSPRELMTYMGQWDECEQMKSCLEHLGILTTYLSEEYYDPKYTEIYTEKIIPGHKRDKTLKAHREILGPIGALAYYVTSTQNLDEFFHIRPFRVVNEQGEMKVTLSTLQGLEILPRTRETYRESLLGYMDKTQTAMGSRKLKQLFATPLYDLTEISARQDVIKYFLANQDRLIETREQLSDVRDLERILAKVSTNKVNAGDLLNTARAIDVHHELSKLHKASIVEKQLNKNLKASITKELVKLAKQINDTINDEIGASLDKGNLIKPGCNPKRDKLAKLSQNASSELTLLEERYREETGIAKLRIKSNNVAGYFIEVSKSFTKQVPEHFQRRQTLVNSERYTTDELNEFEKEIISAGEKLERMEREIFKDIVSQVATLSSDLQDLSDGLSLTDSLQSLAWMALQDNLSCPEFIKGDHPEVHIEQAWHPLIKNALKDQFVCHDLNLNEDIFFGLITGPNMAGKTTVMREVAIIQTLAQIGSFVPAAKASIGLCDFLFSRLGASDDILKGQSTFMVEMAETAEIIRHATHKSLVILDEVGRGTSTYDGLSIAWALCEHLIHNTQCITLFATHYHELIDVIDDLPQAKNLTVETQNKDGDVQFLYRLIEKGASQSFGIYVAKLAGLPPSLLHRAEEILSGLEEDSANIPAPTQRARPQVQQLSFFPEGQATPEIPKYLKDLEDEFKNLDINNMTPLQMMNKVQSLKELIQ